MAEDSGDLAVLGILYEPGEAFPLFDTIIEALPEDVGAKRNLESLDLDLAASQPTDVGYYRYDGSLTTPPCAEGVTWFVAAERQQLSAFQIEQIASHLHGSARPVQPLNERELFLAQPAP